MYDTQKHHVELLLWWIREVQVCLNVNSMSSTNEYGFQGIIRQVFPKNNGVK